MPPPPPKEEQKEMMKTRKRRKNALQFRNYLQIGFKGAVSIEIIRYEIEKKKRPQ